MHVKSDHNTLDIYCLAIRHVLFVWLPDVFFLKHKAHSVVSLLMNFQWIP